MTKLVESSSNAKHDLEHESPIEQAEHLRLEVGIESGDLPVDLDRITGHLGIKVYYAHFSNPKISGMLITDVGRVPSEVEPGRFGTVFLKKGEYPPRARFTLAHEIGHFVLGHANGIITDFYKFRGVETGYKSSQERDANDFAAELLMPKIMFTQLWYGGLSTEELSLVFAVSAAAISTRSRVLQLQEPLY